MLPFPLQHEHVTIAFRHMAIAEQLSKHIDELQHPRLLVQAGLCKVDVVEDDIQPSWQLKPKRHSQG